MDLLGYTIEQFALRYVQVREAMVKRFPKLTPRAAREWRHRWAPHEAVRIDEILRLKYGFPLDESDKPS
jgi:hypothetical protein